MNCPYCTSPLAPNNKSGVCYRKPCRIKAKATPSPVTDDAIDDETIDDDETDMGEDAALEDYDAEQWAQGIAEDE